MRLKKIKLAGFKSFVDPTSIPFPDDMTAIVGPNGCGKSNVIDAVRWVLGESSARNLRGDAMTDVIFNGSTARKPVSQCSVELVFDNSSGRIQGEYAKYNELSVKRLVTRDGQSNYFLNASKCRRRDVTDLFLGTGLGPRSYAIIEQGMISRLIESKPQELRVFIEEAAGISKYKERRRETESRIRHCRENLDRLNDVRGELGQQLEKLQRQAAAAKRYKELKAKERKLKSELAALRWLKHSNQLADLEQAIAASEAEIEAFVARQRGDERGMIQDQERQQDLKQQLTDIQNQYFQLGNQITRLEQTQIHARQRRQQIEQELRQLNDSLEEAGVACQQDASRLMELHEQLELARPEMALLEEQSQQANFTLLASEQQWQEQQDHWRRQEQGFYQLQQQCQTRQSQIQSLQTLLERAGQRRCELEEELALSRDHNLEESLTEVETQQADCRQALQQARDAQEKSRQHLQQTEQQLEARQASHLVQTRELHQLEARLTSLQTLQRDMEEGNESLQEWLKTQAEQPPLAWQQLKAEPGWETALETVLQHWLSVPLIASSQMPEIPASQWLLVDAMTTNKPTGSLAAKVLSHKVPHWLQLVQVVEAEADIGSLRAKLQAGQSLITQSGHWHGRDWSVLGIKRNSSGMLDRARQIEDLSGRLAPLRIELAALDQAIQTTRENLQQARREDQQAEAQVRDKERLLDKLQQQVSLLETQRQNQQTQQARLTQQIVQQQAQIEEDQYRLEELAAELEALQLTLEEDAQEQQSLASQRENLQQELSSRRAQAEEMKNRVHRLALEVQGLENQLANVRQSQARHTDAQKTMQERKASLEEELLDWQTPLQEQSEQLQELLEQRVEVEQQQTETANQLAEVEERLQDAQKGQQGINDRIQRMKEAQQSLRLEYEGCRVRANGVLEQLQEMNQPLKPVLESLDEAAEEQAWQEELDRTSAAVSRLGAVNLAAVEEYEIQAGRKQHLDEQNDDLTAALETLESAIRKIDKETRSRFRDTFDKVNNDLKMLFPKVFGGGSAYLELTDDDLLETGVTIMARPPGKKNSTIHLLSGGEKALTALSLVFAIFRLNPAPFCLLDEVDAPLDDANVGRFCKLVSEMSRTVQFIYITHNKIAMEMAKHLTGVTMAEPGVSRMVAVDVDEAVALAEL
ncbi:chromosome segregation protein SMC [Bowmanella dokdonensis]|uniref:Chromosome partition protein Smc n=1 Tax=Bowmanella dokdonensis TaxID=751969 RepID=A0A939DSL8_9ALTE|nr:chromosome segregation protein SMC [Bowmanella dokdonensis]MBN7827607.1 chromosome segregation protein SMC [Bowmanella dokdonensis]